MFKNYKFLVKFVNRNLTETSLLEYITKFYKILNLLY